MRDEAALDGGRLHRLLQFLEGAHLDLPHPLARDAVLLRQILERRRVFLQSPLGQDVALAVVEMRHRLFEEIAPEAQLLPFAELCFLALAVIDQPILPLALAVAAQRRVQRVIGAGEPPVHADDIGLRDVELGRDLFQVFGRQIAFLHRLQLALELAQVEEQLLLCRRRAHFDQRPGVQDVFLDGGADPPHRVGREAEAAVGVEALDRLHHADIALRDQLGEGQTVAAIAHRDLGDEAQMARDQPMRGIGVFALFPALGEHVFLVRLQHRKLADLLEIPRQVSFAGKRRDRKTGHFNCGAPIGCQIGERRDWPGDPWHCAARSLGRKPY